MGEDVEEPTGLVMHVLQLIRMHQLQKPICSCAREGMLHTPLTKPLMPDQPALEIDVP